MSNIAIRVEKLSKKYSVGVAKVRYNTLRDHLVGGIRSLFKKEQRSSQDASIFWALKAVSLEIKKGEVVGIVGLNGVVNRTLLKIRASLAATTHGAAGLPA